MTLTEYIFIYPPKVYSTYRNVVYVESKYNVRINEFLSNHYSYIKSLFNNVGLEFHYLPVDIESDYLVPDMVTSHDGEPDLDINEIAKESNSELLKYLNDDSESIELGPSLFFCDKKWHGKNSKEVVLKALTFDDNPDLSQQIESIVHTIATYFSNAVDGRLPQDEFETTFHGLPEDGRAVLENAVCENLSYGVPEDEIVNAVKRIIRRHRRCSSIVVKKDYRIFLGESNNKEVKLGALPKALYLFFLKHPEGINKNDIHKYMPEIAYIYLKVWTRRVSNPLKTIKDMVVGNQLANNLTKIRDAFQKSYDLERNSIYSLEPDKKHPQMLNIDIPENQREWQYPDILHKQVPQLPPDVKDMIIGTWNILHGLKDKNIDEAIGMTPPRNSKGKRT